MLKKQNRLSKINKNIKGLRFTSLLFNVIISDNEEGVTRFGFIVSKKISKSAVLRNKTKRVLAKAIEDLIKKINTGRNVLVISKKKLDWKQENEVKEIFIGIFKKAKILE